MTSALIFGRAKSVWQETQDAQALGSFDYVIGVGPTAAEYPGRLDAWVWFHTERFKMVAELRAKNGYEPALSYWAAKYRGRVRSSFDANVPVQFIDWSDGGSSGLIAVMVALREFNVDRIVLAGIPMTVESGQVDSDKMWTEAVKHQHSWKTHLPTLKDKVRSMSGWTAALLGTPTADWLAEGDTLAA